MKDKELNLEEIKDSHTLGGVGGGRVQVRGKWTGCRCYFDVKNTTFNRSHRIGHKGEVSVPKKNHDPVCM